MRADPGPAARARARRAAVASAGVFPAPGWPSDAHRSYSDGGPQPVDEVQPAAGHQGQPDEYQQRAADAGDPDAVPADHREEPEQPAEPQPEEQERDAQTQAV